MSRVLLVSFAGYPYTPSSLMPDNGLACLAAALAEAGPQLQVLDYGTVSTVRRLFPPHLSRQLRPLAEKLFVEGKRLYAIEKLRLLRAGMKLGRHQAQEVNSLAACADEAATKWNDAKPES